MFPSWACLNQGDPLALMFQRVKENDGPENEDEANATFKAFPITEEGK